jgi:hypothetical protein
MKKLHEYSQEVAEWFVPAIADGTKFTKNDLIQLQAICGLAALEAHREDESTYTFSEAAEALKIAKFEGYPEFNHDNNEADVYDAWWASHFNEDEWTAFAAWCRDMINALPSSAFQ